MSRRKILVGMLILIAGLFLVSAPCVIAQELCEGNFDCDQDVDGTDAAVFKQDFGRSPFFEPCDTCIDSPCPCTTPGCDPPVAVPKTGQTTSYATGDDGDLEKGVAWPNPRFTDNGDGTVTDNLTGLIWLKNAYCFGSRTWNQALSDCNGLASGVCGLTDGSNAGEWRLPSLFELESLRDMGHGDPALPPDHPFDNVFLLGYYWTSTTIADVSNYAGCVDFVYGLSLGLEKLTLQPVWPVR